MRPQDNQRGMPLACCCQQFLGGRALAEKFPGMRMVRDRRCGRVEQLLALTPEQRPHLIGRYATVEDELGINYVHQANLRTESRGERGRDL
jgi:hypothetical protein